MKQRAWMGALALFATLLGSHVVPPLAAACPRCSREGVAESLVTATFVSYDASANAIRVEVDSGLPPATYTLAVASEVRPARGERRREWEALERGARLELVVRSQGETREVVRARLTPSA